MTEQSHAKTQKSSPVALIAVLAVGVAFVAGGVLLRRQQDQNRLAAIAATERADATPVEVVAVVSTVTQSAEVEVQAEEGEAPPATSTPQADSSNQTAGTLAPPTPTAIPASSLSLADSYPSPSEPPPTAIPSAAEPIAVPKGVTNILLLGSDIRPDDPGYRTDTIIVVSVNRDEGTVNMLSLPRDLYVYIPGWTMNRINTADSHGSAVGWPGGGPGLVRETLLYNFGIQTDHYVRVDFNGFQGIVDSLGGIDVPVDCTTNTYVLIDPTITANDFDTYDEWVDYTADESNWEEYTFDVGVHHLDGYLALRYARSRLQSSDYDRARRQQQVLRAIWNEALGLGWLEAGPQSVSRLTSLWVTGNELVETSMGLGNALQLAPIAAGLDTSQIRSYFIGPDELIGWTTPDGSRVSLPEPGAIEAIARAALQPPAANVVAANTATVEVRNGSSVSRLDEVAADRLGWDGLIAVPTGSAENSNYSETIIYDYKASPRGGQLYALQVSLSVPGRNVITEPDPNRTVDYLVIVGQDFAGRSCS